jgi:hypothetical protein
VDEDTGHKLMTFRQFLNSALFSDTEESVGDHSVEENISMTEKEQIVTGVSQLKSDEWDTIRARLKEEIPDLDVRNPKTFSIINRTRTHA